MSDPGRISRLMISVLMLGLVAISIGLLAAAFALVTFIAPSLGR